MELEFKNPFLLSKILEIANKGNVADCAIVFSENSITTQTMDSSHVSMIYFSLDPSEVCNRYDFKSPTPLVVGLSIVNYLKVMKLMKGKKNVSLGLSMDTKNLDVMTILVNADKNVFNFDLKLMDIEVDELMIPPYEDFTMVAFPIKEVSDLLSPIDGDVIEIGIAPDCPGTVLYTSSSDVGTLFGKITDGEVVGETRQIKLKLSLLILKNFCAVPSDLSPKIEFYFKEDFPLAVKYKFGENSRMEIYIAPKIDDDMEP
jgi:proliferating cell nuclear antigen PCNA